MKPARELLFSVVSREEKYKSKNFIDTAILRSGDTISGWLYTLIKAVTTSAAMVPAISVLLGAAWCAISYWLGNRYEQKHQQAQTNAQSLSSNR